ncbi:MAG: PAS domain S-box protein [Bacteroidia bacterium]
MGTQLFDFNFDRWYIFLLFLIPAVINLSIFLYLSFFVPLNRTNRIFSLFVLLLGIGQACDGFMHMSNIAQTAMLLGRSSNAIYIFICPIGLLFTLRFTKWHKMLPASLDFILLFVPSIVLHFIAMAHLDTYSIIKSGYWKWVLNPEPSFITNIIYAWMVGTTFITFILLWLYFLKEKTPHKKHQAFLLVTGFSAPFVLGVVCEVAFPLFLNIDDIPLTSPFITIFSVTSIIAIRKYNMLDYSPRHQWENIINTMNEGLLIVDKEDRIMFANKKFCKMSGYTWEELKNNKACELLSENIGIKMPKQFGESGNEGHTECFITAKSGKKRSLLVSWSPYLNRNGETVGYINMCANITRLKEMEKSLYRNNTRLNDAQKIAHVGSWEVDLLNNTSIWSEEACRIYGMDPTEKEQTFQTWLSCIHIEDQNYVKNIVEKTSRELKDASFKHRIVCRDGTVKHIHSISKFEFNEDGIPIGLFGICHDITEQHKAEQALIESEKNIRNFASYLNKTIENERNDMAREIHDEFGQYLTGIKLGLSSLQKHFKDNDALKERFEMLLADMEACQQSTRKVANKLRPGILDTLGLIPSLEWFVKDFQKKSSMKVDLIISNGVKKCYDPTTAICFFRICQEALTNISKHANATETRVEIFETDATLKLKISDNGKGIKEEKLNNPFSIGLLGMRERANLIRAAFQINNKQNGGTIVELELKEYCYEKENIIG